MDEQTFLEACIRIPSPSGHEADVAAFLVEQMHQQGFDARIDEAGNAVGSVGHDGPLVVLLGHIDTVPGDVPIRIEDGKLYGRGVVDAKGAFATFVCAAARAARQETLHCRVVLVGAVEEEAPSSKGAHHFVTTCTPDFCVIGEPSGWNRMTLGYKGRLLAHYQREQAGSHSAGEQRAAPEYAVDFWNAVSAHCLAYNDGRERLFEQISPSLRHIVSSSDGLTDRVEATVGLRLPEAVDPHELAQEFQRLAGPGDVVTFEGACPAFRSSRTTPLAQAFARAIRTAGSKPGYVHKTGTSDMNIAGPAWNCPIVAYGPGDSRLDHTPNEHLHIAEYQQAIGVMTSVLEQIGQTRLDR